MNVIGNSSVLAFEEAKQTYENLLAKTNKKNVKISK